jgi:DNA-binding NtrC family response regulator
LQDIHLPGLDGHETLNAIRKADPAAYVVMLSVDAVKTNIVEASKGGASGFLKKPFTKDRMIWRWLKARLSTSRQPDARKVPQARPLHT